MKNLYKRDAAEYGIVEIQSTTPFFTIGRHNSDQRYHLVENFINAQIIKANRDQQFHDNGTVGPYQIILQHPMQLFIFRKDKTSLVDSEIIMLPKGQYSSYSLHKLLTDNVANYIEDLNFDIQIAIGSPFSNNIDDDIISDHVIRLISQSESTESALNTLLEKTLGEIKNIESLYESDVVGIRIYSLEDNLSWSMLLTSSFIHSSENSSMEDILKSIFHQTFRKICESGFTCNKFELVISPASIAESIDRKLYQSLMPLSKYTSLQYLMKNDEVIKIGDSKFDSLPDKILGLFKKQPAWYYPVFVFETLNEVQFLRSWCIHIDKSVELNKYNELFSKIFGNCKNGKSHLLFVVPTELEETGYLLEQAESGELRTERGIESLSIKFLPYETQAVVVPMDKADDVQTLN